MDFSDWWCYSNVPTMRLVNVLSYKCFGLQKLNLLGSLTQHLACLFFFGGGIWNEMTNGHQSHPTGTCLEDLKSVKKSSHNIAGEILQFLLWGNQAHSVDSWHLFVFFCFLKFWNYGVYEYSFCFLIKYSWQLFLVSDLIPTWLDFEFLRCHLLINRIVTLLNCIVLNMNHSKLF